MDECIQAPKKIKNFTNDVSKFYENKDKTKKIFNLNKDQPNKKIFNQNKKKYNEITQQKSEINNKYSNTKEKKSLISEDTIKKQMENNISTSKKVSKKVKHYDNIKRQLQNFSDAGFVTNKNANIEDESFLLLPAVSSKQKSQMILKDHMHPTDFGVELKSNNIRKVNQYTSYYGDHHGPGRGIGNSDINNMIRNGESSRIDRDMYNLKIESNINTRQDILFKNYQDPKHLILPFPRGGEITRKTHLNKDYKKPTREEIKEFTFKY